jgi:hypothetical protein
VCPRLRGSYGRALGAAREAVSSTARRVTVPDDARKTIGAIDAGSITFKLDAPAVRIPIGADAVIAFGRQVQGVCVACGERKLCLPVRVEDRPPGLTDWCGPCLVRALSSHLRDVLDPPTQEGLCPTTGGYHIFSDTNLCAACGQDDPSGLWRLPDNAP